jgi:hypothetical protein
MLHFLFNLVFKDFIGSSNNGHLILTSGSGKTPGLIWERGRSCQQQAGKLPALHFDLLTFGVCREQMA